MRPPVCSLLMLSCSSVAFNAPPDSGSFPVSTRLIPTGAGAPIGVTCTCTTVASPLKVVGELAAMTSALGRIAGVVGVSQPATSTAVSAKKSVLCLIGTLHQEVARFGHRLRLSALGDAPLGNRPTSNSLPRRAKRCASSRPDFGECSEPTACDVDGCAPCLRPTARFNHASAESFSPFWGKRQFPSRFCCRIGTSDDGIHDRPAHLH